ncbi:MAG: T9SS type A sorting domain-containing protein, partial [Taibaiella sp.]|nr:T9SS type A sorting domain-containing protein [Taibaiella sp.]
IELQVGRVDFYDMPAFSKTEEQLMKSYLNKAHQYKTGALAVTKRALVDDNFKTMPEGFGGNGWRNFAPLVGSNNVEEKDLISTLNTQFYQWAYGCGGGSYTSCGGVGTTANIAANDMKAIFTPMFGSYFGDWNYKNNFLRAPLCADEPSLASFWAGRPNWFLHHMALGENIGYSTRLSQNNNGTFYATPIPSLARIVTTALMGDPTLRTEYVKPASGVTFSGDSTKGAIVSWTASTEPGLAGYYVYRSTSEFGEYKLRSGRVTGTSYTDSFGTAGTYWYMVRPAKLQTTPSGTYYNLGLGASASGTFKYPHPEVGIAAVPAITNAHLYPNPAGSTVQLSISALGNATALISVTDLQGRTMLKTEMQLQPGNNMQQLNLGTMPAGMYLVHIQAAGGTKVLKLAHTQ